MNTVDTLRAALSFGDGDLRFIEPMRDAPLTRPMPGGNHALWILGHLTIAEGRMHQIILGEPNPVTHWKPLFDWGTQPSDDPDLYPPFDEVLETYKRLLTKTLSLLDEMDEDGLDQPVQQPPPGLEDAFATVGQTLLVIAMHQAFHSGQASVARRAGGHEPYFEPSQALRDF
jgi:uncharacterized damage-inducible protein DinB